MTVPCLAVTAFMLVVDTGFWLFKFEKSVEQRFEDTGQRAVSTLADVARDAVDQRDRWKAQRDLLGFQDWPGFKAAIIIESGAEFASFRSAAGAELALDDLVRRPVTDSVMRSADTYYFSTHVATTRDSGGVRLVAAFDAAPMTEEIRQARVNAVTVSFSAFVIIGALLFAVARSVSAPITSITAAIERVAAGDLDHEVPLKSGTTEVMRLVTALDVLRRNAVSLIEVKSEAEATRRVADLATLDSLTGLANRRALDAVFGKIDVNKTPSDSHLYTVLHLDLDGFKQINDTLGHKAGDHVIQQVAERLCLFAGDCAMVARVGGDEFVLLLDPQIVSAPDPEDLAKAVIKSVSLPIRYERQDLTVGASIGVATRRDAEEAMSQTLVHADVALYRAKAQGKGCAIVFDDEQRDMLSQRKRMSEEISLGVTRGEFIPYFQPIVDSESRQIVSVEMLARWQHPELGILTPAHFLAVATDLNMMRLIDRQVLDVALDRLDDWQNQGFSVPRLSINASVTRLMEQDLFEMISEACAAGIQLDLELLESIFLDEPPTQVLWQLDRLRDLGCHLHIDDFGTGHASVAGLLQVRPDKVKIDKQFVIPAPDNAQARGLVELIVGICSQLSIDAVAEGVETAEHAKLMASLGCKFLQGHALYVPMPADDLIKHLTKPRQQHSRSAG